MWVRVPREAPTIFREGRLRPTEQALRPPCSCLHNTRDSVHALYAKIGYMMWTWTTSCKSGKYRVAKCPDHPKSWPNGYQYEHILVAENMLGRLLLDGEIVHHKDGDGSNNDPSNLEVYTSQAEHASLHKSTGWTMVQHVCPQCGSVFYRRKGAGGYNKRRPCCSRRCNGLLNGFKPL